MKSILYVGATLMIGACIYGFVDYKKTSHQKEFTRMYESPEEKETVVVPEKAEAVAVPEPSAPVKKKAVAKEKTTVVKSKVELSAAEKIESVPVLVTTSVKETTSAKKFKEVKKKKLSRKLFSRAALREDREMVILPEPAKVESKKEQ